LFSVSIAPADAATGPASPTALVITARLYIAGASPIYVPRQRYLDATTDPELIRQSEDLVRELLGTATPSPGIALTVRSSPPGAWATLDNRDHKTTDAAFATSPGEHAIEIEQDGYVKQAFAITARQDTTISIALQPTPSAPPTPPPVVVAPPPYVAHEPRGRPWLATGLTLLGTGLITFGAVSIYVDIQAGPEDKFHYTRATDVGAVSASLGVGALVAGLYLFIARPDTERASRLDHLRVSQTPHSTTLGWGGSF